MPLDNLKPPLTAVRLIHIVTGVVVWTGLVGLLIFINLLQLLSLAFFPLSRRTFRRANRFLANLWWGLCVLVARFLNGTTIQVTGDDVPPRENAVVIVNHQQMPDITVIMDFALRKHRLGDLKFFVKDILKWLPGVGWGMLFLGCPYLKREWTRDRASIERTFHTLVSERIPTWMIIFAEGTRITPAKVARSREYAVSRNLPPPRHVLLPRPKGFVAAVEGLRDHVDAVYDLTIGYVEGVPSLGQYITGAVKQVHLHVRRFAVETLPDSEEDLGDWLRQRFQEKDERLDLFYRTGRFHDTGI